MTSVAAERVARRFVAGQDLPKWAEVEAALRRFDDLYQGTTKVLRRDPRREDRRGLKSFVNNELFPLHSAIYVWFWVNFPEEYKSLQKEENDLHGKLFRIVNIIELEPNEVKDYLVALERYTDRLNGLVSLVYPASFTYQGLKVYNDHRFAEPLARKMLDGLDFVVALFKKRGMAKGLLTSLRSVDLGYDPGVDWHGLYWVNNSSITINGAKVLKDRSGRLWKNWVQEIFIHEFGHHIEKQLPREAQEVWKAAWGEVEDKRQELKEKLGVTKADRIRFFDLLGSNDWNPSAVGRKLKGLDKVKFGAWLRNPDVGEPFITAKQFRPTKRGLDFFDFFRDPEGSIRESMNLSPGTETPEDTAYIQEYAAESLERKKRILGLGWDVVMPVPAELTEQYRKEDKSVDEALNKLDLPSDYARTNAGEDFAESFVSFMVNPGALSDQAMFRMKQALSLAGLYGKPVMKLAQRVARRYLEAGYLNVGDVILYGKFKNAKGRIVSFGMNEKGDPTMEVQPIDSDGKDKPGKPKTITILKVRKVTKS